MMLEDPAQIFVGDVLEEFHVLQFAVMRDPSRVDVARELLAAAMERVIARSGPSTSTAPAATFTGGS